MRVRAQAPVSARCRSESPHRNHTILKQTNKKQAIVQTCQNQRCGDKTEAQLADDRAQCIRSGAAQALLTSKPTATAAAAAPPPTAPKTPPTPGVHAVATAVEAHADKEPPQPRNVHGKLASVPMLRAISAGDAAWCDDFAVAATVADAADVAALGALVMEQVCNALPSHVPLMENTIGCRCSASVKPALDAFESGDAGSGGKTNAATCCGTAVQWEIERSAGTSRVPRRVVRAVSTSPKSWAKGKDVGGNNCRSELRSKFGWEQKCYAMHGKGRRA